MRKLCIFLCIVFTFISTYVVAQDASSLYSRTELARGKTRLEARVREIFYRGLQPQFTTVDPEGRLANVQLRFPLVGIWRTPIDFYADSRKGIVHMPILSLKFLEDLCTAYAWLWANEYSLGVFAYPLQKVH